MRKLKSLSIFFPFYNDAGTVIEAIDDAYLYGGEVTNDLEVIAIHCGRSIDKTAATIRKAKRIHPDLIIIDKRDNDETYAVIKHGFKNATKDWVFYTDGDLQYHLDELGKLVRKQKETGADVVNGYKIERSDDILRVYLGIFYKIISQKLFHLPIRDTDCDFRLIRKSYLDKTTFEAQNSSILPELIKKLETLGAKFSEVPVRHYSRIYGKSNYGFIELIKEKMVGDLELWLLLRKKESKKISSRKNMSKANPNTT